MHSLSLPSIQKGLILSFRYHALDHCARQRAVILYGIVDDLVLYHVLSLLVRKSYQTRKQRGAMVRWTPLEVTLDGSLLDVLVLCVLILTARVDALRYCPIVLHDG